MFVDPRPVTGYAETVGWQVPLEPQPTRPPKRAPVLKAAYSRSSLGPYDNPKRPALASASSSKASLIGMEQSVPPLQEFIKRTPRVDPLKPLPPIPLKPKRRRSSYSGSPGKSSRNASPALQRRTSSVYSRTASQWMAESPIWSASDFADEPVPPLPLELLRPIAYSASTPQLVENPPTPPMLEPRYYQPLLATPSPTVSRSTTPSPPPLEHRPSTLLPEPVATVEVLKKHLRMVSLERAKAVLQAPGAEPLLPEELRARVPVKSPTKSRSHEVLLRDTMMMFTSSPHESVRAPELPTLTMVDAQGRDRAVGSPRASVAPMPGFGFAEALPVGRRGTGSFQVGNNAPRQMVRLYRQNAESTQRDRSKEGYNGSVSDERGRARYRASRSVPQDRYLMQGVQTPSSSPDVMSTHHLAGVYNTLLADQYRAPSASSAASSGRYDVDAREHMKMVPQALFQGKPMSRNTGQLQARYASPNASVSPFARSQASGSGTSMQCSTRDDDELYTLPRLETDKRVDHRRRSTSGTIPISPPSQYEPQRSKFTPAVPSDRKLAAYRRNSDDNRVSQYFPVTTRGTDQLLFRRSDDEDSYQNPARAETPPFASQPTPAVRRHAPPTRTSTEPILRQRPSNASSSELTAKQALFSRITRGAAKYAELLTRPAGQEPPLASGFRRRSSTNSARRSSDKGHSTKFSNPFTKLDISAANANPRAKASIDSPDLHSSPSAKSPPGTYLGWTNAAKSAFDQARSPTKTSFPPAAAMYVHTTTPARPLDERQIALPQDSDDDEPSSPVRRGSIFTGLLGGRREAKAEKRREDIKKSIRVVVTPEAAANRVNDERSFGHARVRSWEVEKEVNHEVVAPRPGFVRRMSEFAGMI
nr:hypothetical protein B0A51_07995 [Rachicladosporium sp. CCFEE 5018]OQO28819.1 hypothetical protein B0A51_04264 [Rachicladosporium sp. CCFEE 5018]